MENSYARLLKAAKELKNADNPAAVARLLGISDQTIQNWKTRGVPIRELIHIENTIGALPRWIDTGQGDMTMNKRTLGQPELSALQKEAITLMENMPEQNGEAWLKIGAILAELLPKERRHEDIGHRPERRGRRIDHQGHIGNSLSTKKKSKRVLPKGDN